VGSSPTTANRPFLLPVGSSPTTADRPFRDRGRLKTHCDVNVTSFQSCGFFFRCGVKPFLRRLPMALSHSWDVCLWKLLPLWFFNCSCFLVGNSMHDDVLDRSFFPVGTTCPTTIFSIVPCVLWAINAPQRSSQSFLGRSRSTISWVDRKV